MVDSDSNTGMMFLANLDERSQTILYLLQFLSIFLIGILQFLERPGRVYIVAGVYSDLIGIQGSYIGNGANLDYCICDKGVLIADNRRLAGYASYPLYLPRDTRV